MRLQHLLFFIIFSVCISQANYADPDQTIDKIAIPQKPEQIVSGFYAGKYLEPFYSDDAEQRATLLSKELGASFSKNEKQYGEVLITFDPFVNGQDAKLSELKVDRAIIKMNRALVYVNFLNFDQDISLLYVFVCENDVWKLDEIASIGDGARWLLTDVLLNP